MEELGSSNTLKDVGLMALTAGATRGLGQAVGAASHGLKATAVQAGVSTLGRMMSGEKDLGQAALQGTLTAAATSAGALAANQIGEMYRPAPVRVEGGWVQPEPGISWGAHKILHGSLGFALGAASDLKNPLRGGAGGAIGAAVSETLVPMLPETWASNTRLAIGSLGGATAAFLAGQDVNAAGLTAVNALENNDLAHPPLDAEGERVQQEQIERGKQVLGEGADWLVTEQEDLVRSRQGLIDSGLHGEAYLFDRSQDPRLSWWERIAYQERASEAFDRAIDAHTLPTNRLDQLMGAVEVGGLAFSGLGQIGRPALQGARAGLQVAGTAVFRGTQALRLRQPVTSLASIGTAMAEPLRFPAFHAATAGMEKKITWVAERAAMGHRARIYNDSVAGARSNVVSKIGEAPSLSYIKDGTIRTVRFDGVEDSVLIDRKLAVVTTEKAINQASRQSEALLQNGYLGRWEVPNRFEAERAQRLFDQLKIRNIIVRIVNEQNIK